MHPLIPYFEQPVINLGPLPLHGFGIMVAAGFLIGGQIAMKRAERLGLDPEAINRLIGWLVVGTFIGGHVGYGLLYAPAEYFAEPIKFLKVWDGLSSFGGFFACILISIWFFKRNNLPLWPYLDCLGIGMAVGFFLGRTGCFLAHDHPGSISNFWLAVPGICSGSRGNTDNACHDMGLYEALFALCVFFLFLWLDRKPRVLGFYPLALGALYGPVRFYFDGFRPEATDVRYLGLTPGQYWSLGFFLFCSAMLIRRYRSGDEPVWAPKKAKTQQGS